jgi:hypothetical protein
MSQVQKRCEWESMRKKYEKEIKKDIVYEADNNKSQIF